MDEAAYEAGESSGYADWVIAFDRLLGMDVAGPTDACEQVLRMRDALVAQLTAAEANLARVERANPATALVDAVYGKGEWEEVDPSRAERDALLSEYHDQLKALLDRLAAAEQILSYCASPTLGWNPSKGPIQAYVREADENLVRSALQAIIFGAQRFLTRDASGH